MATNEEMRNYESGMKEGMGLIGEDQANGPYSQDNPEALIPIVDQGGQEQMVDPTAIAAEGMAFSSRYMTSNGPTRATHIGKARTMTKGQLREQRMNEDQGYPSSLDEAGRIKELEGKVTNIETGISQILSHLHGKETQPAQPNPPLTVSSEWREPESRQLRLRQVTLKDGRKISVPVTAAVPMSLGPATDQTQPPAQDEDTDGWDDPIAVVPEQDEPSNDFKRDEAAMKTVRVQQLVQDVNAFMQTNDVHRFWRRHLSQNLHRHVGYNGWPKELQTEFDTRFKGFLQDPQFVTSICRKVLSMELGHALGVKWVVSFLVASAGFTAFTLVGLDG
ncbi:hypothetical protein LCGC14_0722150 [marine sediment metagenome]|uniref:Uncharacterized protein n=1 Tax=marine sediment metagenome TaxID=412755 RepID=A0A0F9QGA0_9ZZZZ